jgi:hypothetical protein
MERNRTDLTFKQNNKSKTFVILMVINKTVPLIAALNMQLAKAKMRAMKTVRMLRRSLFDPSKTAIWQTLSI